MIWGALGLTLANLAREAQSPDADPRLLEALSQVADGRYPHSWGAGERARAIARDTVEPLAAALLSSYVGAVPDSAVRAVEASNGNGHIGAAVAYSGNGTRYTNAYPEPNRSFEVGAGGRSAAYWAGPNPDQEATLVQPRKKVRVSRKLVVGGNVVGEQVVEDIVPLSVDTEAAAARLRTQLDALYPAVADSDAS
jgi:hypothetical protein